MKLDPGIKVINSRFDEIHLSVYLAVVRGEKTTLIDAGTKFSPQNDILPELKESGLSLKDVDYILNTHGHNDHIGGDAEVKKAGKAKIAIHEAEAAKVENSQLYLKQWFGPVVAATMGKELIEEEWRKYCSFGGEEVKVDIKFSGGEKFDLGNGISLIAVHLPGHVEGSSGFYVEKDGILFAGDSFPCLMDRDGAFPNVVDLEGYKSSVKKVLDMPVETMVTAHDHFGITTEPEHIREGEAVKKFLNECYEVGDRFQEAIGSVAPTASGKPFEMVYNEVVKRMPEAWGFTTFDKVPIAVMSGQIVYCELKKLGAVK